MNTTVNDYSFEEEMTISPTVYIPHVPLTEADKIVIAINALNKSVDKRLDRLTSAVLSLVRVLEHR